MANGRRCALSWLPRTHHNVLRLFCCIPSLSDVCNAFGVQQWLRPVSRRPPTCWDSTKAGMRQRSGSSRKAGAWSLLQRQQRHHSPIASANQQKHLHVAIVDTDDRSGAGAAECGGSMVDLEPQTRILKESPTRMRRKRPRQQRRISPLPAHYGNADDKRKNGSDSGSEECSGLTEALSLTKPVRVPTAMDQARRPRRTRASPGRTARSSRQSSPSRGRTKTRQTVHGVTVATSAKVSAAAREGNKGHRSS